MARMEGMLQTQNQLNIANNDYPNSLNEDSPLSMPARQGKLMTPHNVNWDSAQTEAPRAGSITAEDPDFSRIATTENNASIATQSPLGFHPSGNASDAYHTVPISTGESTSNPTCQGGLSGRSIMDHETTDTEASVMAPHMVREIQSCRSNGETDTDLGELGTPW